MKKVVLRLGLTLILACLLALATVPYWVSAVGIPSELKVFPGMELQLDLNPPFRIQDQTGLEVTGLFDTENLGTSVYRVNLFGWLPLTEVVVDVVPLVRVFPGGQSIGVLLSSDGLMIADLGVVLDATGVERFPARDAGIKPGDVLLSIEGHPLRRPEQVSQLINALAEEKKVLELVVRRNDHTLRLEIEPVLSGPLGQQMATYLLGIYLEDPAAGVGTMSFYDRESGRFGALGHTVTDSRGRPLTIAKGSIVEATIDGIRYGSRGTPGEKVGFFHGEQDAMGIIDSNTSFGIFGSLAELPQSAFAEPVPVAFAHQVRLGPAEIYTVLQGNRIERFAVEIIKVVNQTRPGEKGMIVEVTDERLLRETGGIIQGMSGSPILQNGMLVGAITHVFVNNPTKGYGSFAEWMVYEAGLGQVQEIPAKQSVSREGFFLHVEKDFNAAVLRAVQTTLRRGVETKMEKRTLVLGVIGSDVHAVGNKILEISFKEAGFTVVNLGVLVSQKEFVEAAVETNADAIMVSSLYGHGEIDVRGLREALIEAGIGDILLYIGGYLVVGSQDWSEVETKFRQLGFDRVYPPSTLPEDFIPTLKGDLGM
ncbi:MAG: SpoIVB peptidase [Limnochordia bacterium]|nr:SpoIVB peptidase [Limnochordia bacterium]